MASNVVVWTSTPDKRLGWRDLQRAFEAATDESLEWFFEQWVRSSKSPNYRITAQRCDGTPGALTRVVRVERAGTMRIPITVEATLADGSKQRARTERLTNIDELAFAAPSPLERATIAPDAGVVLVEAPPTATASPMLK